MQASLKDRFDDPQVSEVLHRLLDRIDALEAAVEALTEGPHMAAMVTDIVDETVQRLGQSGIDLDTRMKAAASMGSRLTEPATMNTINQSLDLLEQVPATMAMFTDMADEAIRDARKQPVEEIGMLGLMRKLRDPDIQRAVNFLLRLTKNLGQTLKP